MSKYTVVWDDEATEALAQIWLESSNRQEITQAAKEVDDNLTYDSSEKGSEFLGARMLVVHPIWVVFKVQPEDCVVTVLQVRLLSKGSLYHE